MGYFSGNYVRKKPYAVLWNFKKAEIIKIFLWKQNFIQIHKNFDVFRKIGCQKLILNNLKSTDFKAFSGQSPTSKILTQTSHTRFAATDWKIVKRRYRNRKFAAINGKIIKNGGIKNGNLPTFPGNIEKKYGIHKSFSLKICRHKS